jgi:hypothetical protein
VPARLGPEGVSFWPSGRLLVAEEGVPGGFRGLAWKGLAGEKTVLFCSPGDEVTGIECFLEADITLVEGVLGYSREFED